MGSEGRREQGKKKGGSTTDPDSPTTGPETELWLYSTLERTGSDADDALDATASSSAAAAQAAGNQAAALMHEVRRLRETYSGGPERAQPQRVLVGGLNERLRRALTTRASPSRLSPTGISGCSASTACRTSPPARCRPACTGAPSTAPTYPPCSRGRASRGLSEFT